MCLHHRISKFALIFAVCGSMSQPALAADDTQGAAEAAASPTDSSLQQKKSLEGHIQGEALSLEAGIKDLTKSLHHLKRSAFDIFAEVQRQDMVVVGEPDVIGPIIIPAIPSPSGMMAMGGFLPPRKKFLDYFLAQIDDLFKMVQTEVTGMVLPDDATDEAKTEMQAITDTMKQIPSDIDSLKQLTAGPKYDNLAIAKQAAILQNDIVRIEKASKKINEEMKKEVSRTKKDMREIDKAIKKESSGK